MSRLLFDENGVIYLAHQFEEFSIEEIKDKVQQNLDEIALANRTIAAAARLSAGEKLEIVESPVEVVTEEVIVAPVIEESPVVYEPVAETVAQPETVSIVETPIETVVAADPTLAIDSTVTEAQVIEPISPQPIVIQ